MATLKVVPTLLPLPPPTFVIELSQEEAQSLRKLLNEGVSIDSIDTLKLLSLKRALAFEHAIPNIQHDANVYFMEIAKLEEK